MSVLGDPKYAKEDLPVPATLVSYKKELRVHVFASEYEMLPNGDERKKPNTGLRVKFEDYRLVVKNKLLLKELLGHRCYNEAVWGYAIDPQDPSGFWRAQGKVKEVQVTTFALENGNTPVSFDDLDFKDLKNRVGEPKSLIPVPEAQKG